ncbi:hypothetical protein D3C71_1321200 [compost metagenome]
MQLHQLSADAEPKSESPLGHGRVVGMSLFVRIEHTPYRVFVHADSRIRNHNLCPVSLHIRFNGNLAFVRVFNRIVKQVEHDLNHSVLIGVYGKEIGRNLID